MSGIQQYRISSKPRHLRFLFFIGENYSPENLRKLMISNLRLWGGRYNPIVPVKSNIITEEYRNVIKFYDPDIVYYSATVDLNILKSTFDFNPSKFINLDKPSEFRIDGVKALYFQNETEKNRPLAASIGAISESLKDFYSLNFLCSDNNYKVLPNSDLELKSVEEAAYTSINEFIFKKKIQFCSDLSSYYLDNIVLRCSAISSANFEIIIANEKDSLPDLFYYWNRKLFVLSSSANQMILSKGQMEELLKDKYFEGVLYDLARGNSIYVTSFSLQKEELDSIVSEQLKPLANNIRFEVKLHEKFPFDIYESHGVQQIKGGQPTQSQVFTGDKGLLYLPGLDLFIDKRIHNKWAVDIDAENVDEHQGRELKYSTRLNHEYFIRMEGRINKRRSLTVFAENSNLNVEFKMQSFENSIRQIIYAPKIFDKSSDTIYHTTRLSSDGLKLRAFINLFQGKLSEIDNLLHDKFWVDILIDLSSNVRIAGDTISFEKIKSNCIEKMSSVGIDFEVNTHNNDENLGKGIRSALAEFCQMNIFFIGFNITCKVCSSKFWYSLRESQETLACKGCGSKQRIPIELPFSYKLNDLVKNNLCMRDAEGRFKPDGNLTVLKTILRYHHGNFTGFEYSPQLNLYPNPQPYTKPITDLDIICQIDGKLIIGEAKNSSNAFEVDGHRPLHNLADIAKAILPDKVVITCTEDANGRLENKRKYLESLLINFPIEVEAFKVEEASYQFEHYWYFHD